MATPVESAQVVKDFDFGDPKPNAVGRNALVSYGRFLLSKQALFVAMLGLASFDRFRLTPALEYSISAGDHAGALRALRLSRGVETARIVSILALVAWLGTLEPPASAM